MRVLITGGTGQVGTELLRQRWPAGLDPVAPLRSELDLSSREAIEKIVASERWGLIINCGAYTAVDRAETEPEAAWSINGTGPGVLAAAAARHDLPVIHISTDYVFDGRKASPYVETDPVSPINVYGASKEAGECGVRAGNPRHLIIRTSWIYSAHGTNFVKTMLRLARERPLVRVVDDQYGCPTSAADLAATLIRAAGRMIDRSAPCGTLHLCSPTGTSWHGFASRIFSLAGARGLTRPAVEPIPTSQFPTAAKRPADSRLDCDVARSQGLLLRPWEDALVETVDLLTKPG